MSNLSDFGERKFIDYALRRQARPASTYYLGLSTGAFDEGDSASSAYAREPSGNGYARRAITFGIASNRTISNSSSIIFPQATGQWGTITHWAIFDGPGSTANLVAQGSLTGSINVDSGVTFTIAVGDLDITLSSVWALNWANWLLNGFFNASGSVTWSYVSSITQTQNDGVLLTNTGISASAQYRQGTYDYYLAVSPTAFDLSLGTRVLQNGQQRTSIAQSNEYSFLRDVSYDDDNFLKEPWGIYSPTWFRDYQGNSYSNYGNDLLKVTTNLSKGYARQQLALSAASTTNGVTTVSNSSAIQFPTPTASWGSIGYWAIYQTNYWSYATDGGWNEISYTHHYLAFTDLYPIMGGAFDTANTVSTGDTLRINAGDFVITPQ
jgi:hypothetical protein